ncbi:MAG: S1C family serine protease, partial [Phycisphaerales bacterium]|nr:S1C family serine protease [Phycisphaerales bacterium]
MARLTRMSGWTGMILAAAGAATPAFAGPEHTEHEHNDSQHSTQTIEVITDEGGKRYQIIVQGDEVDARVDGLRISPDRVHREANEAILLDEDGNKIKAITIGPSGGTMRFGYGGPTDLAFVADIERPPVMLGVLLDGPGDALRSQLGVSEYAVLIEKVMEGLPADKAGLKQWDIIVEVEGEPLDEEGMLHRILMESKPGHELDIVVLRRGAEKKLRIELEAYSAEALGSQDVPYAPVAPGAQGLNWQQRFSLESMPEQLRKALENIELPRGSREKLDQAIRELSERGGG